MKFCILGNFQVFTWFHVVLRGIETISRHCYKYLLSTLCSNSSILNVSITVSYGLSSMIFYNLFFAVSLFLMFSLFCGKSCLQHFFQVRFNENYTSSACWAYPVKIVLLFAAILMFQGWYGFLIRHADIHLLFKKKMRLKMSLTCFTSMQTVLQTEF